jgi:hypothetical protein
MATAAQSRAPAHLWIVGILSLLWNCFGAYDYLMTRLHNMQYLASMGGDPQRTLAYVESLPLYGQIGWGLGVWAALLGSVLLLIRSRYAVHAFVASLIGMVLSFGAQWLGPPAPPEMTAGAMKYIPLVILALGIGQLWYAARERKAGVLR